jgi:predicted NAD-dependent protein-ADP-ribosyltransferase YbiA (DUF1768 family)
MDHLRKITTSDGIDVLAFQSGWCPLSNCHRTPITIFGHRYLSVHQYVLCEKARHFNDNDTYNAIKKSNLCAEQTKLGGNIKGYNDEKLAQHPLIFTLLKTTGNAIIAQCGRFDAEWGTGIDIDSEDMKNRGKWGKNYLGKELMELRANGLMK